MENKIKYTLEAHKVISLEQNMITFRVTIVQFIMLIILLIMLLISAFQLGEIKSGYYFIHNLSISDLKKQQELNNNLELLLRN